MLRPYSLRFFRILVAALLTLAACSDESTSPPGPSDGTSPSDDTSTSSSSSGGSSSSGTSSSSGASSTSSVDLTFSGDITATLQGTAGTCGGVEGGASFQVQSDELDVSPSFSLSVIILGEEDWATPPTVLNVRAPTQASYVWNKTTGTVVAMRDRSRVDIDTELRNIATGGTVMVKGSIVCSP